MKFYDNNEVLCDLDLYWFAKAMDAHDALAEVFITWYCSIAGPMYNPGKKRKKDHSAEARSAR